jgi:multidrug resistance efflux pump
MFEPLRDALRGFSTRLDPDERRSMTQAMRDALVHAKLGLNDLRATLSATNARLAAERAELETVRRRQGLAAQIGDQETVAIAERFAVQHAERVAMLETKHMVQQQELSLAERDYDEMSAELRLILAGVAPGAPSPASTATEPTGSAYMRAEREADAEQRLADLKRRMGK